MPLGDRRRSKGKPFGQAPQGQTRRVQPEMERQLSSPNWNVGYFFTIIETLAIRNQISMAAWPRKGAYPEAV